MPHRRHILEIVLGILGLLCLALAFDQLIHPVLAIIETTGRVVDLVKDPTSPSTAPRFQPVIQYRSSDGHIHLFTADFSQPALSVPATYRVNVGDSVPIQYYPWTPGEAQFGSVGKIIIFVAALQWSILLGSGVVGLVLLGTSGYRFYKRRQPARALSPERAR